MSSGPDFEDLLARLRAAELEVGARDLLRLGHVLRQEPDIDLHGLRELIVALLARSRGEVETGRRVFDAWVAASTPDESTELPPFPPKRPPGTSGRDFSRQRAPARPRRTWRRFAAPAALALTVLVTALIPQPEPAERPQVEPPPATATAELTLQVIAPPTTYRDWVPTVIVLSAPWPWANDAVAFLALVAAVLIWRWQRDRSYLPAPAPLPTRPGLSQVYVEPAVLRGAQLLAAEDEETLVWGIGRFVDEQVTTRLDLERSVRATVENAGLPTIHFERMRHSREVWLWVDEALAFEEPAAKRLADELETILRASGLPVERADFWGIPDRLRLSDGSELGPNELDERRDAALVVVLTDGHLLDIKLRAENTRVRTDALLRDLSSWPRLAFVDFTDGAFRLAHHADRQAIPTLSPREVPAFLGGRIGAARDRPLGDARAWAAGIALSPQPVDDDTAYALAKRLAAARHGAPSPWALEAIRAIAPGPGGRLQFPRTERIELLQWLVAAEALASDAAIPEASLLGSMLGFWRERYHDDAAGRIAADAVVPWLGTPAEQRLAIDTALLDLWDGARAEAAASVLYERYRGPSGERSRHQGLIRDALALLAARDQPGQPEWESESKVVRLPRTLAKRTGPTRVMLLEMGLGAALGAIRVPALKRPGRLWLALGLCGGLAAAAVTTRNMSSGGVAIDKDDAGHALVPPRSFVDAGGTRVEIVTRRRVFTEDVAAGTRRVRIEWVEDLKLPCVVFEGDAAIHYCGSRAGGPRPADWPPRSLVAIRAAASDAAATELARALLDSGSADAVQIAAAAADSVDVSFVGVDPRLVKGSQFLVLMPEPGTYRPRDILWDERGYAIGDFYAAAARLDSLRGPKPVAAVWVDAKDLGGVGADPRLTGTDCPPLEGFDPNTKVTFVRVCGGSFTMGDDTDPAKDAKEHRVTLSPYWIMKTEVTRGQYGPNQEYTPFAGATPEFPATDLSWFDAKNWCERRGYQLPSEAEWEYAARGGDGREYPWGNAEPDPTRAWYGKDYDSGPVAVGSFPEGAGPFGTLDQAGSVWEWVEDCFGPYRDGHGQQPFTDCQEGDKSAVSSGAVRVLRGGSFNNVPRDLRSAYRSGSEPGFSIQFIGFRCVRAPRRQPSTP